MSEYEAPAYEPYADPGTPTYSEEVVSVEEVQREEQLEQEYEEYAAQPHDETAPAPTPAQHASAHPADPTTPIDVTYDAEGDATQGVAPTSHVIGDPNEDASQWTFQGANGYCGPDCLSMLIEGATGEHLSEQQIATWAIDHGEMTRLPASEDPAGEPSLHYGMTPQQAVATLNAVGAQYGFSASLQQGNMTELDDYLKQGREVMIEIDAQRIWHEPGQPDSGEPDHFVVVTGFDPSTNTVFIDDPGTPDGKEESIPLKEFESAWATSDNTLIVTSSTGPSDGSSDESASSPRGSGSDGDGASKGGSGDAGGAADGGAVDDGSGSRAASTPGPIFLPVVLSGELVRPL